MVNKPSFIKFVGQKDLFILIHLSKASTGRTRAFFPHEIDNAVKEQLMTWPDNHIHQPTVPND